MSNITRAKPHLTREQILERLKTTKGFWRVQQWLVVLNGLVDPRPAAKIAAHLGVGVQTVRNWMSRYNRLGPQALETPGKGGRRRQYLTVEQEQEFLRPFFAQAATGQMATVSSIKEALEARLGHQVHKTTLYRLLARNGWRKVVPRPTHPNSSPEEREEFKKNSATRR